MMTLTNLRGAPYSFRLFGSQTDETYGMVNHGDYFDFTVGVRPAAPPESCALDVANPQQPEWELYRTSALATGAFPVGLAPRLITRTNTKFYAEAGTVGFEDSSGFVTVPPDPSFASVAPYAFISVDGGVIDNAPFEIARRNLAGRAQHNPQNGRLANKAVLLVAPFPNFVEAPPADADDRLVHVVQRLLSALIDQARFKPDELEKAADDFVFSRFMISPARKGNGSKEAEEFPIASGTLHGFGGFLHESFRRHDYLLGRRNAQAFLRWNFGLPETNPLFQGLDIDPERWQVRNADGQTSTLAAEADRTLGPKKFAQAVGGTRDTPGFPIIPLVDRLLEPIVIPPQDMPRPDDIDLDALTGKIRARARKVIATLVDVDLQKVARGVGLESGLFALAAREGADWIGAPFLAEVATKKAMATIDAAVEQVRKAFAP